MNVLIAGAGIGGLTTALCLHAVGIEDLRVVEAASEIRPLGVGLNILPNAVAVLAELGLYERLAQQAVLTEELALYHRRGDLIWRESRGLTAGYRLPQLSIHRGYLQAVLLDAVRRRLGPDAVRLGCRVTGRAALPHGRVRVQLPSTALDVDVLVGADGIRSAVRASLYPQEGTPPGNGMVMWRGTSWGAPFLTGRSMIVTGDDRHRIVLYPIRRDPAAGGALINWVAARPRLPGDGGLPRRDNRSSLLDYFGDWRFDWLDIPRIFNSSGDVHLYAIEDRDPLPRWTHGRTTLLGDAAHAMYPMGSNGATQAIVDADTLARLLADGKTPDEALAAYESDRRPAMTALQRSNRETGPEIVITIAHQRAPDGFSDINDVIPAAELAAISRRYARTGGFDVATVNRDTVNRETERHTS